MQVQAALSRPTSYPRMDADGRDRGFARRNQRQILVYKLCSYLTW